MNAEQLLSMWDDLPTPETPEHLEASELGSSENIWVAVDHTGARHLLILVPENTQAPTSATKGLRVTVTRHRIPERDDADYIDLTCLDEAMSNTFATVGADIASDLSGLELPQRSLAVSEALARWRWFWGVTADRLSEPDALGLFAELWFLEQWVSPTPENVEAWTGSEASRHDFQWPDISVEVKATARRADGAIVHTIQHLDQLANPETGVLFLFSLRVVRDRLAGNTLPAVVERCSERLRGRAHVREAFLRKVALRGYSPAHRRLHETPYRILDESLYEVANEFPRLTSNSFPTGLPPGISEVSYKLDMAVCTPWLRGTGPEDWPPVAT